MNKPKVDWLRIIWKCHEHFRWPSMADAFAHGQEIQFAVDELVELRKRQATGQLGHQSPRKNIYKARYFMETDLDCDDPLYDGEPVF